MWYSACPVERDGDVRGCRRYATIGTTRGRRAPCQACRQALSLSHRGRGASDESTASIWSVRCGKVRWPRCRTMTRLRSHLMSNDRRLPTRSGPSACQLRCPKAVILCAVIDQELYRNSGLTIGSDPCQNAVSRVFCISMIPSDIDHGLALAYTKRKRDLPLLDSCRGPLEDVATLGTLGEI